MLTITHNANNVAEELIKKGELTLKTLAKILINDMRWFEAKIVKEQMSGRKSENYGLNVQTRLLRNSWRVAQFGKQFDTYRVRLATSTIYARIHQFGGMAGAGKRSYIPKRLHIYETFKTEGRTKFVADITAALQGKIT